MYTLQEQLALLDEKAKELGYVDWADYEAKQLNWADEEWDY